MTFRRIVKRVVMGVLSAASSWAACGADLSHPRHLDASVVASAERDQRCVLSPGEVAVLSESRETAAEQVASRKGIVGRGLAGDERFVILSLESMPAGLSFDDPLVAPVFRAGAGPSAPWLFPTGEVIVRFEPELTAAQAASCLAPLGLTFVRPLELPGAFLFKAASPARSLESAASAAAVEGVLYSAPNWLRQRALRQEDPLYACQWHLKNTGQFKGAIPGNDLDVEPVWASFRGTPAQIVCIVDDGLELAHKDLSANVIPGLSWDYVEEDPDPTAGSHGTAVGGVSAGRGFNGLGGRGVAPEAGLCGHRILGGDGISDADEADAETRSYDRVAIYNNSWGPEDDAQRLEGPRPMTQAAMARGLVEGRGGRGTLYTWAGGNGRRSADNSNYDGYANWRGTIAVAATTSAGVQSLYSENGANLCVNAPSNGGEDPGITTTDRTGTGGYNKGTQPRDFADMDFTDTFGGTSSATPAVSGVCALLLQARPDLGWRDVKTILMTTAAKNDSEDPDWSTNGAGYHVNHKYGFGRADAAAAVEAASRWINLPAETSVQSEAAPGLAVPPGPVGVSSTLTLARNLRAESVEVVFTASTADKHWGDLQVLLVSPSGTWSVLAEKHDTSESTSRYDGWRFGSERYLGEPSAGDWTLLVKDLGTTGGATFGSWRLVVYGTEQDAPAPATARRHGDRSGSATATFLADPACAGTTEPGATASVAVGVSFPILAVPAIEYREDQTRISGFTPLPCTFSGWTADPPENATFADAGQQSTTVALYGDVALTGHFRSPELGLSPGAGIRVTAADLGLVTFSHRPIVKGIFGGKILPMKVYGQFPSSTFVAGWPARPKIYRPADYQDPPQGLGALLEAEPMASLALDELIVKTEQNGPRFDLAASRTFRLVPPVVTKINGTIAEGSTLDIDGLYFGTKAPKVFVEYGRNGNFLLKECDRTGDLIFKDLAGEPSCMEPWSESSTILVTCPQAPPGAEPTGYVIVKSATGMGSYFTSVRRPVCE
jgi:subtilisin-like proprotein convertase family protein